MSAPVIYSGYSGTVWGTAFAALAYYTQNLNAYNNPPSGATPPSISSITLQSEGIATMLSNGVEAIDAYALNTAWLIEINALEQIAALPLTLDPTSIAFFNARLAAYQSAQAILATLIPQPPFGPAVTITSGVSPIPSAGLLEFFSTFSFETAPSGLTAVNLISEAYTVATSFMNVANAILAYQGNNITQLYDVAYREYLCAQSAANLLNSYTAGGFASNVAAVNTWNQIVALPAMLMCADSINSAAFTQVLQQQAVLKNLMLVVSEEVLLLLLSLRQPQTSQVNVTTILQNETLIDVAARALGNFELWPQIASLNGLIPPYTAQTASSGVAAYGSQIVLPTPGTQLSATGITPSYAINFLGTDLYIGPINGSMPVWTGDFQVISGYNNLRISLGRRIQTTLNTLIYHNNFGSRIPPEVGNVQTNQTAGHITAYGKSALASDPRVASVISAMTQLGANGLVSFAATVQPGGFSTAPLTINEVLSPVL